MIESAAMDRNACFTKEAHPRLLDPSGSNILPYVLLPLCAGTPSLSDLHPSDELSLPSECQFLPPEKKREADRAIRGIFVEALLLLATTREGREDMRDKRVYRVVQMLHEQEPEEKVGFNIRQTGLVADTVHSVDPRTCRAARQPARTTGRC